jgi:hypothetical protein
MGVDWLRASVFFPVIGVLVMVLDGGGTRAGDQDTAADSAKKDAAARLDEMKQIAGTFHAVAIDGGNRVLAPLVREPLYRWDDPTREFSDGTLWFWRASGRPIGVLAIEHYPQNKDFGVVWNLEFTSLATGPIEVEGGEHFDTVYTDLSPPRPDGTLRWAPMRAGLEFREIADAPAPANTSAERLRQMRDLVKRFSAREFFRSREYTLRLISHPIDRYAGGARGPVDGAIFVLANGTNPEILLLVEATRRGDGAATWSYAAAPLARAEVTLRLDKQDVWKFKSREIPLPSDTYFLGRRRRL